MFLSILSGLLIGMAGALYLKVGGIAGAIFFATGLLIILNFKLELFTGKAGLLVNKQIKPAKLIEIWFGNFIGTFIISAGVCIADPDLCAGAIKIVQARLAAGTFGMLWHGFLCGLLMYAAVTIFNKTNNPIYPIMCVTTFILVGSNHIVADMFYLWCGMTSLRDAQILIPVTIGNLLGCITIPLIKQIYGGE